MRLPSYNIQYGFGREGAYRLDHMADVIKSAEIAALPEVDRHWQRTLYDDQPALSAEMLPDHHIVFAAAFDMDAATPANTSRRRQFGPMILSRWPIVWSRTHLLPWHRPILPPAYAARRRILTKSPLTTCRCGLSLIDKPAPLGLDGAKGTR